MSIAQRRQTIAISPKKPIEAFILDTNMWISLIARGHTDQGENSKFDESTMKAVQKAGGPSKIRGIIFRLLLNNKLVVPANVIREFEKVTHHMNENGEFNNTNRGTSSRILNQMRSLLPFEDPAEQQRERAKLVLEAANTFLNYALATPEDSDVQKVVEKMNRCQLHDISARLTRALEPPDEKDRKSLEQLAELRKMFSETNPSSIKDDHRNRLMAQQRSLEKVERRYSLEHNNWTDMELLLMSGMANKEAGYNRIAVFSFDKDLYTINETLHKCNPFKYPKASVMEPSKLNALINTAKDFSVGQYINETKGINRKKQDGTRLPNSNTRDTGIQP